MKLSGKISIKGMQLPEKCPVKAQDIEIDYEVHYAPDEVIKLIGIIDMIPQKIDVIAEAFRKVLQYEEEFNHTENTPVNKTAEEEVSEAKQEVASSKDAQ